MNVEVRDYTPDIKTVLFDYKKLCQMLRSFTFGNIADTLRLSAHEKLSD